MEVLCWENDRVVIKRCEIIRKISLIKFNKCKVKCGVGHWTVKKNNVVQTNNFNWKCVNLINACYITCFVIFKVVVSFLNSEHLLVALFVVERV